MGVRGSVLALVAAASVAMAQLASAQPASAQAACTFKQGFQYLASQIPWLVGSCLEDERQNPSNGNMEQRTTGGLLVWRQADNWTAFTNGSLTWLVGPTGEVWERPNDGPLYAWETQAPTAPAAAPAITAPSAAPAPSAPEAPPAAQPAAAPPPAPPAAAVPAPAPAPARAPSAAVEAYVSFVVSRMQSVNGHMQAMASHFSMIQRNNATILDPAWQAESDRILGEIRRAGTELQGYSPVPPEGAALDGKMKEIGRDLVYFADEMSAGIRNLDTNRLNNAKVRLEGLPAKIERAGQDLELLLGYRVP